MRSRTVFLLSFLLLAATLATPSAHALATSGASSCQWVCAGGSCRLQTASDGSCAGSPGTVDVASDPQSLSCQDGAPQTDTTSFTMDSAMASTGQTGTTTAPPQSPAPAPAPAPPPTQVLLTGFCPFAGLADNPSQRILPAVQEAVMAQCGQNVQITTVCLMVDPDAVHSCDISGRIVISLGVDVNADGFRLETGAVNEYDDGNGNSYCFAGPPLVIGDAPRPTLPPKIGNYPVADGPIDPANNYVCNATYYWLCNQSTCTPYFLHVPNFGPDQDAGIVPGLAQLVCNILAANKPAAKTGTTTAQ